MYKIVTRNGREGSRGEGREIFFFLSGLERQFKQVQYLENSLMWLVKYEDLLFHCF